MLSRIALELQRAIRVRKCLSDKVTGTGGSNVGGKIIYAFTSWILSLSDVVVKGSKKVVTEVRPSVVLSR